MRGGGPHARLIPRYVDQNIQYEEPYNGINIQTFSRQSMHEDFTQM